MLKYWKRGLVVAISIAALFLGLNLGRVLWLHRIPSGAKAPSTEQTYDVAVIGGGAAGSMAAYRAVLNNDETLWVTGDLQARRRSRGFWVPYLSNTPIYAGTDRPLIRYRNDVVRAIARGPQKDKLALLEDSINKLSKGPDGLFVLEGNDGQCFRAKYVILATGMTDEQPQINGSIQPILPYANDQQAIYCSRCDAHLLADKETASIIGNSSSAAQNAILLHERYGKPVSIVTNGHEATWPENEAELLAKYNIEVYTAPITAITERSWGALGALELSDKSTVPTQFIVVALGIRPNNELAKQIGAELDERGLVISDQDGKTSVAGLFVVGDLRADTRKQVYVAWDSAVRSAEAINRQLRAERRP